MYILQSLKMLLSFSFELPPASLATATEWLFTRSHIIQMAVALSLLLLLPTILKTIWKQWRIFSAFQKVPCDTKNMHLVFGHAPM